MPAAHASIGVHHRTHAAPAGVAVVEIARRKTGRLRDGRVVERVVAHMGYRSIPFFFLHARSVCSVSGTGRAKLELHEARRRAVHHLAHRTRRDPDGLLVGLAQARWHQLVDGAQRIGDVKYIRKLAYGAEEGGVGDVAPQHASGDDACRQA